MKKTATILFFVALLTLNLSCGKDDIEKGIDCVAESIYEKVKHTADATDPKKSIFQLNILGIKH